MRLTQSPRYSSAFQDCCVATWWSDAVFGKWLAWNYAEDCWFEGEHLDTVDAELDSAGAKTFPDQLIEAAANLGRLRRMTGSEQRFIPTTTVTHVPYDRLQSKFDLAPASHWVIPGALATSPPTVVPGDVFEVMPAGRPAWITFPASKTLPHTTNELIQGLGLTWTPDGKPMLQVVIPSASISDAFIPTIFDSVWTGGPLQHVVEWRARPDSEKYASEPWGHARDMLTGKAGLPELIARIAPGTRLQVRVLEPMTADFSGRPYLAGHP